MSAVVRVPATSANLGPGFDSLGLALDLHDEVAVEVTDRPGVRVEVAGEGAGELPTDETHLVVRAVYAALDALAADRPAGLLLTCHNRIPQARGLGSSSAAIVAGLLLGRSLVAGGEERLDRAAVLRLGTELEGHPDNIAACVLGGFTIAWRDAGAARAVSLAPAEPVRPTVFIPQERGLTVTARAALPGTVPHPDAAHAAGRGALLVHAMTAAPELLLAATEDRLHQPYRAGAAPETAALVAELRAAGVAAVVSGAGPTVLALSPVPSGFRGRPGWISRDLRVDPSGAVLRAGRLGAYAE